MTGAAQGSAEARYRRNARSLHRLLGDLTDPAARRRAICFVILHYLGSDDGPAIAAAVLLRHGFLLTEDPLLERWTLVQAGPEQFGLVAFMSVVAGRERSIMDVYARYGRQNSARLGILAITERVLAAGDPAQAARWPAETSAPARVVIDQAAKFVQVLGRLDVERALRQMTAEIDRTALAGAPTVLLSPNFFHAIGHMVLGRAMADQMRLALGETVSFRTVRSWSANGWLAQALSADIPPGDPPAGEPIVHAMSDTLVPVSDTRGFKGAVGTTSPMTKVCSWAAARWMEAGQTPIKGVEDLRAEAQRYLETCGVEPGRFLVTLHVRDSGYRGPSYADGQRDGTIERYGAAIDAVVAAGGAVVVLGDPSMAPVRPRDHVIDYAHSDQRSERLDVALTAACRFHIGTASGMSFVPLLFGKPILFTNWITLAHVVVTPNTLHLPKPLMSAAGERVSLARQCTRYSLAMRTEHIEADGLYFQENSSEEILDATRFMMQHLEDDRLRLPEAMVAEQTAEFGAHGLDPAPMLPPSAMAAWKACG